MKKLIGILLFSLAYGGGAAGLAHAQNKAFINSLGLEFALIPAGQFTNIWTTRNEAGEDVQNRRVVTISRPFYLGKYEVTQRQWQSVMGGNPSGIKGWTNPVEQVSWEDVQIFIWKLNQQESGKKYRLPTEAEWEYAARAGSDTAWFFGDDQASLGDYAWFSENSQGNHHPVGKKKPNPWGLYDIYGNVAEWVDDWYEPYQAGAEIDPTGPEFGAARLRRGGSWASTAEECRSDARGGRNSPRTNGVDLGFRLAVSPDM